MIGRFLVVQPVPAAFYADTELMYDCLRILWEEELFQQFGKPLPGPLFFKRVEYFPGVIDEWLLAGYIPIMIHGPAYTAVPPLNPYRRRKR